MVINNCITFEEGKNNELRSLLIHEMLHGLGFTSLITIKQLSNNDAFNIENLSELVIFNNVDNLLFFLLYLDHIVKN